MARSAEWDAGHGGVELAGLRLADSRSSWRSQPDWKENAWKKRRGAWLVNNALLSHTQWVPLLLHHFNQANQENCLRATAGTEGVVGL